MLIVYHNQLNKTNDFVFEKERNNPQSVLMRINSEKNTNNPDAKLFMDIALVHPDRVPSTQDYQYLTKDEGQIFNKKYNLTGNKEILPIMTDSNSAKILRRHKH